MIKYKIKLIYVKLEDHIPYIDCRDKDGKDLQGLQKFLCKHAIQQQADNLSITYIIYYRDIPIGYITISTASIRKNSIEKGKRPRTVGTSILPAIIIQNFAIDKRYRGKGFGKLVLAWCNGIGRKIANDVGCRYIILYAREAKEFYLKNGFLIDEESEDAQDFELMYRVIFPEKKNNLTTHL